jgi:hypothetical protein
MNIGSSTKLIYDNCAYQKNLQISTSPLIYQLYEGKHENCTKCKHDKFWRPFDLVDVESELLNITRPNSKCDQFKYDPTCKKSKSCTSTFDKSVPIVYAPEICPIIKNNIPKMTTVGYELPVNDLCKKE